MAARTIIGPNCWEFQGCAVGPNGYGQIDIGGGKRQAAHRVAWQLANGGREIPADLRVLHSCDNPRCVNPAHLSLGTQAENLRDSIRKGRYNTYGIQKLNALQVLEIRARGAAGEMQRDIAAAFGIARNTVSGILNRKSWAHLDPIEIVRESLEAPRQVDQPVQSRHAVHCAKEHTGSVRGTSRQSAGLHNVGQP